MAKFYAVAVGRKRGIYRSWNVCEKQVKGFTGARFKSFKTLEEAQAFLGSGTKTASKRMATNDQDGGRNDSNNNNKRQRTVAPKAPIPTAASSVIRIPTASSIIHMQLHLMFDGGSRGNPGIAGAGAVLTVKQTAPTTDHSETLVWHQTRKVYIREYMPQKGVTNNQAEYQGLCLGLERAKSEITNAISDFRKNQEEADHSDNDKLAWDVNLIVQGDSQLVIRQVQNIYQCKAQMLIPYRDRARRCLQSLATISIDDKTNSNNPEESNAQPRLIHFRQTMEHVLRKFNSEADALANQAMDAKRSWVTTSDDRDGLHPLDM